MIFSRKSLLLIAPLSFCLINDSIAHSGRTNADGCHNQKSTGTYHCHGGSTTPTVPITTPTVPTTPTPSDSVTDVEPDTPDTDETDTPDTVDTDTDASELNYSGGTVESWFASDNPGIIFNWAEKKYPELFSGSSVTTQETDGWSYRHYPDTGAYLGLNDAKDLYVMGGGFGDQPSKIGASSTYLDIIYQSNIDDLLITPYGEHDQVLQNESFSSGYSYGKKAVLWSMYKLYPELVTISLEREDNFREDERLPEEYRATLDDYSGSGYDRGHLAPNAALDHSESSQDETFYLSNITPQEPDFNRYEWSDVEAWVRECAASKEAGSPLVVITGAVYPDNYEHIGNNIAIPESLYKIVAHLDNSQLSAFAVLAPQSTFRYDYLASHITTIDEIESVTGIDFFKSLDDSIEAPLESSVRAACDLPSEVSVASGLSYTPSIDTDIDLDTDTDNQSYSCSTAKTCSTISSCGEARYLLNSCGVSRLDGDKDGVPCESLCR